MRTAHHVHNVTAAALVGNLLARITNWQREEFIVKYFCVRMSCTYRSLQRDVNVCWSTKANLFYTEDTGWFRRQSGSGDHTKMPLKVVAICFNFLYITPLLEWEKCTSFSMVIAEFEKLYIHVTVRRYRFHFNNQADALIIQIHSVIKM